MAGPSSHDAEARAEADTDTDAKAKANVGADAAKRIADAHAACKSAREAALERVRQAEQEAAKASGSVMPRSPPHALP